jgi:hypothetical protein
MKSLTILPVERFTWYGPTRTFCAEASDFNDLGGGFKQIYPDACDAGLAIRGRDGRIAPFYLAEEHKRDGDITHWTLLPTPEALRIAPRLKGVKVEIFND